MDSEELQGWIEYFKLEPFGEVKRDHQSGLIASAIYNVNRSSTKDHLFEPSDFIPDYSKNKTNLIETEQQDWEFTFSIAQQYASIFNK